MSLLILIDDEATVLKPSELTRLIRRAMRRELASIKELLVSQSAQIQAYLDANNALLQDVAVTLSELLNAAQNPNDTTNLSPEATALINQGMAAIDAFRASQNIGDANEDGVPAAPEQPVEPTEPGTSEGDAGAGDQGDTSTTDSE